MPLSMANLLLPKVINVFAVSNPAKGEIIAHVADFGAEGIQTAIEAAEAARHAWAARTAKKEPVFCAAGTS